MPLLMATGTTSAGCASPQHACGNSRNRPSCNMLRFAGFAHRGSVATLPQKNPRCNPCALLEQNHVRITTYLEVPLAQAAEEAWGAKSRPSTRREPDGWEGRARSGTALPTPAAVPRCSLAPPPRGARLVPPAPLRHSLALPVSTTGRAWAARLPREPKRSIRGDWRYGRFYQLTGTVVPEGCCRHPGTRSSPCTRLGGTPAGPGWGARGSPSSPSKEPGDRGSQAAARGSPPRHLRHRTRLQGSWGGGKHLGRGVQRLPSRAMGRSQGQENHTYFFAWLFPALFLPLVFPQPNLT